MASTKTQNNTTWVTPDTFVAGQLVTAQHMNTMRDNFLALKTPAYFTCWIDEAADYTTTSTSFVDIDTTNAELTGTITTAGGAVLLGFSAACEHSSATAKIYLDFDVDGTRLGLDDGIYMTDNFVATEAMAIAYTFLIPAGTLAAGSHVFKAVWKTSASTATLYAGAGTSNKNTHPNFWGHEVG